MLWGRAKEGQLGKAFELNHQEEARETSLAVQWLRLHDSIAEGAGLIWELRVRMPRSAAKNRMSQSQTGRQDRRDLHSRPAVGYLWSKGHI